MAFTLEGFIAARPYLYHLTAALNVPRIRRTRVLSAASRLLEESDDATQVRIQRRGPLVIQVSGEEVHLRDQDPLKRGNLALAPDWRFEDFLVHLNSRVFFWPGTASGPIPSGRNHFARYAAEETAVLRVPSASLLAGGYAQEPLFCKYNSGAPRCTGGRPSPRYPDVFDRADRVPYRASEVIEVTFVGRVTLPPDTEIRLSGHHNWAVL